MGSIARTPDAGGRSAADVWGAGAALVGGTVLAIGTLLPWLSLFAGLQPYRGVIGLNGRLLLAAGIGAMLAGAWLLRRGSDGLRRGVGGLGVVSVLFAAWLAVQLWQTSGDLARNPMLVARMGPGLWVSLAGACIVSLALLRRR